MTARLLSQMEKDGKEVGFATLGLQISGHQKVLIPEAKPHKSKLSRSNPEVSPPKV